MTREDRFAEYVANGYKVHEAGKFLGLTPGQTARVWSNIKRQVGVIDYR